MKEHKQGFSISLERALETGRSVLIERSPLAALKAMAKQFGRFFRLPLPRFHPFVVFGPAANRKLLVTEWGKLRWRNTDPVTDLLRQGVLVVDGEEHDRYRALLEAPLHPARLPAYTRMMIEQTDRVASVWKDGQTVDMLVESRKIALLIVMQALFSRDVWQDVSHLWQPILKAIQYISPGMWIFWRKLPRLGYKRYLKVLDEYLYKIIAERRRATSMESASLLADPQEQAPALQTDLLQHLIEAGLSDALIRDQMLTMLIAGHDTSTALLAWCFALLGQHPDIHRRLVEEVSSLDKSPLLDQVIKESLRLYPPIHVGTRHVEEGIEFPEGRVPAGERLFYSIYLTQRDPEIWDNADNFCPQRFAHGRKTPPFSYLPFGGGPRACPGAAFGQVEARIVLARLLRTYRFAFSNHKIHAHMGATLEPRPGVRMKVTRRRLAD